MTGTELLRNLPAVDEVLRHSALATARSTVPRPQLLDWIRAAVDECRASVQSGFAPDADAAMDFVIEHAIGLWRREDGQRLQPVINATGILLHTNLGRAPLADRAVERMQAASAYANVELDLHSGKRSRRGARTCELLRQLTGAEDALFVNNCAAATMLVLQTTAAGREVIVSRGQLVEIGGGFRLPEVFAASGARLREVGTTNRTYLRDYEAAITENSAAIIRVHRSNFYQGGFVTEPGIRELVALGREVGVPVIDDVGSGCVTDARVAGQQEPNVIGSVTAGADLTLFSGDKLFGGPQAGIIVGRSEWIERCRRNPLMRALRLDKTTIAALEATTEIHLEGTATTELPLWRMLTTPPETIRRRCERIHGELSAMLQADSTVGSDSPQLSIVDSVARVGGGSAPGSEIASFAICLSCSAPDAMAAALRHSDPGVLARISDATVTLDLRTVDDTQLDALVRVIQAAIRQTVGEA